MRNLAGIKKATVYVSLPALFILLLLASYTHFFDSIELDTLDLRVQLRPKPTTSDKIVFVEIDDETLKTFGQYPLPREYHAGLIKALTDAGARSIFFDIIFSDATNAASDDALKEAIRDAKNIYLPYSFYLGPAQTARKHAKTTQALTWASQTREDFSLFAKGLGHINVAADPDGKYRKIPLYIGFNNTLYPFASFLLGCEYLGINEKEVKFIPGKSVACSKDLSIPLDENSNLLVNFTSPWVSAYTHVSYRDVYNAYLSSLIGQKSPFDTTILKDKICIICLTATGTTDLHPNAFDALYPAAGIHAEVINSMITKKFIVRAPAIVNILLLIVLSVIIALVSLKTKPVKGFFLSLLGVFTFVGAGFLLFDIFGVWIDLFLPAAVTGVLYTGFNLYKYVSEWKKRLLFEQELDIAKKIQQSFLPKSIPEVKGLTIAATMLTAKEVGGDLYDFVEFDESRIGVMIGDVSGKGVPASLFMAMAIGAFGFFTARELKPCETLGSLNAKLAGDNSSNLFVTVFYAIFDTGAHTVTCANGGHMPLLRVTQAGEANYIDAEEGMPLGIIEGPYSQNSAHFSSGDTFIFYTDGVTEATNARGQMYGKERLIEIARAKRSLSAQEIRDAIALDVRKFEPKSMQHDDMTLIIVKTS